MHISVFDLFKIGIGPSSSHTVGPMRAAKKFLELAIEKDIFEETTKIKINLHGSLASTGIGHGTDKAIIMGLFGFEPEYINIIEADKIFSEVKDKNFLLLLNKKKISFDYHTDLDLDFKNLPQHPNGMEFVLFNNKSAVIYRKKFFSVGGGFFLSESEINDNHNNKAKKVKFEFKKCDQLLEIAETNNLTIAEIVAFNELIFHKQEAIDTKIMRIWSVMQESVHIGCQTEGILPGGLNVSRRAPAIYKKLLSSKDTPQKIFDWVSLYALAVNEQNAAGGRVVTAPTNGAAGIIPATLHYYEKYHQKLSLAQLKTFFFTAGAIGFLYKENASISGAEMGCQGEVGVACSMAAGGLAALRECTNKQIEVAAEIGMEHNLGLTCDPVKGLVQIPCIERNTMGAIKAINAARLAQNNDGTEKVSLDKVIRTMKQIGLDMKSRYKETSRGGLAINVIEC